MTDSLAGLIHDKLGKIENWIHLPQLSLPKTSMMDSILMSNLIHTNLKAGYGSVSTVVDLHLGILSFLLIPLLALGIGGFIGVKLIRAPRSTDILLIGLGIAILHGAFLVFAAKQGGFIKNYPLPLFFGSFKVQVRYPVILSLLVGFLNGFIFSIIGALCSKGARRELKYHHHGDLAVVIQAGASILTGVALFSFPLSFISLLIGGHNSGILLMAVPQIAWYLWSLALFGSITVSAVRSDIELSYFGGAKGIEGSSSLINLGLHLLPLAALMILIWAGWRLRRMNKTGVRSLLLFSGVYGSIMAFLGKMTQLSIHISGRISRLESNGFPFVTSHVGTLITFLSSFILSFAVLVLVTRIFEWTKVGGRTLLRPQKRKKRESGYPYE